MFHRIRFILPVFTLLMSLTLQAANAATIQLPQTGQNLCYDDVGSVIACAGTGQDGDLKKGVAWPTPRFSDNNNGTVTDNLTGLIWLTNANCKETVGGIAKNSGSLNWQDALTWSNNLADGLCGLSDASTLGSWRLPNRKELQSLIDRQNQSPVLPTGHPFSGVTGSYWSSSTSSLWVGAAWYIDITDGYMSYNGKTNGSNAWPVRGGQ